MSGFGDDGYGDDGDDWELVCNENYGYGNTKSKGDQIMGNDIFHLKHVDTGCMLVSDSNARFTN